MTDQPDQQHALRITILLITAFGGLTALAVGLVLAISAFSGLTSTRELMRDQALMVVDSFENRIKQHLAPAENLIGHIENLVNTGQLDLEDPVAIRLVLKGSLAAAPQLYGVVIWQADMKGIRLTRGTNGEIVITRVDSTIKPGFSSFFQHNKTNKRISWGMPVRIEGATHLFAFAPLRRDGRFAGYITASISSVELSSYLEVQHAEHDVTAFVIYGPNHVLAHPYLLTSEARRKLTPDAPLLRLDQIGDHVLSQLQHARQRNRPDDKFEVHRVWADGKYSVVISRLNYDFGTLPWRIGVYGPERKWLAEMTRLRHSFVLGVVLMLVSVLLAVWLARRIAAPIKAFAAAAAQIGHLELEQIAPLRPSRIKELNDQATAFNQMLAGLRQFETYIPKRLVERLISEGGDSAAQSRAAELTIMFTDIVGFTSISEKLPAADTAEMLNKHFEQVNQCIEHTGGTLDKYIGDSAMAFWGAPEKQEDHARRAAITALLIADAVQNTVPDARWPNLRIKIALHTGTSIVGNIGARTRTNYTVIGDPVNTCSRIEGLAPQFDAGTPSLILLSDETAHLLGDGFAMEDLGEFAIRGRDRPIRLWRLKDGPRNLQPADTA